MKRIHTVAASDPAIREARQRTRQRIASGPSRPARAGTGRNTRPSRPSARTATRRPLSASERLRVADLSRRLTVLSAVGRLAYAYDEPSIRVLPEDRVAEQTWRVGNLAAVAAAEELGVDTPYVYWFDSNRPTIALGFHPAGSDVVLVNASQSGRRLVETCAHEVAHVAGLAHPEQTAAGQPDTDSFATDFARRYAQRLLDAR